MRPIELICLSLYASTQLLVESCVLFKVYATVIIGDPGLQLKRKVVELFVYVWQILDRMLGLGVAQCSLTLEHMFWRSIVVYLLTIFLIRLGQGRIIGRPTSFDLALVLIFGGVVSKAITGSSPFLATLFAGCILIALHWLFSLITVYSGFWGALLKGRPQILIKDGEIQWRTLQKNRVSQRDLMSALRLNGKVTDTQEVKLAVLERNGDISVIAMPQKPTVVEYEVEKGVQKVVLEISCSRGQRPCDQANVTSNITDS